MPSPDSLAARVDRLVAPGVVDMHFDLLMDLWEKRRRGYHAMGYRIAESIDGTNPGTTLPLDGR